jgi:hypothetical protein
VQPFAVGVTTIVAVTATEPLFKAVKDGMLPTPVFARPIEELLFVQVYVVPATAPVKFSAVIAAPLQTVGLV